MLRGLKVLRNNLLKKVKSNLKKAKIRIVLNLLLKENLLDLQNINFKIPKASVKLLNQFYKFQLERSGFDFKHHFNLF